MRMKNCRKFIINQIRSQINRKRKNMQNRTFISVGADAVSLPSVAAERWTLPRGDAAKSCKKIKLGLA